MSVVLTITLKQEDLHRSIKATFGGYVSINKDRGISIQAQSAVQIFVDLWRTSTNTKSWAHVIGYICVGDGRTI